MRSGYILQGWRSDPRVDVVASVLPGAEQYWDRFVSTGSVVSANQTLDETRAALAADWQAAWDGAVNQLMVDLIAADTGLAIGLLDAQQQSEQSASDALHEFTLLLSEAGELLQHGLLEAAWGFDAAADSATDTLLNALRDADSQRGADEERQREERQREERQR